MIHLDLKTTLQEESWNFVHSNIAILTSLLQDYYLLVFHFTTSKKISSSDFFLFHNKFINLDFPWFSFYFLGLVTLIMMICRQGLFWVFGLFLEFFFVVKKHSLTKPLFRPSLHKTHILSRSSYLDCIKAYWVEKSSFIAVPLKRRTRAGQAPCGPKSVGAEDFS